MIRMMQVFSVLTLSAAGLLFARGVAAIVRDDVRPQQTTMPTAVERFTQSSQEKSDARDRLPPLVEQAQAFALYLNPPQTPAVGALSPRPQGPVATTAKSSPTVVPAPAVAPPASPPKFELHGISYYRQQPEQSMALVLEPGGRRRWVHPGEQVGHLTVERIDGNSVVCRDAGQTYVLALAPDEAVTKYARSLKDTKPAPAPPQAQDKSRGPEVPPPAPGIRQMPPARVAALLGQSS